MTESEHQQALIQWVKAHQVKYPQLGCLFSIPNGGYRSARTAGTMKAEGVKSGVWDLFLPIPMGHSCGLFIEMKAGKGRLSPAQHQFRSMVGESYTWAVCYSWHEAVRDIVNYLGLDIQV